jgi:hypothetical protein
VALLKKSEIRNPKPETNLKSKYAMFIDDLRSSPQCTFARFSGLTDPIPFGFVSGFGFRIYIAGPGGTGPFRVLRVR